MIDRLSDEQSSGLAADPHAWFMSAVGVPDKFEDEDVKSFPILFIWRDRAVALADGNFVMSRAGNHTDFNFAGHGGRPAVAGNVGYGIMRLYLLRNSDHLFMDATDGNTYALTGDPCDADSVIRACSSFEIDQGGQVVAPETAPPTPKPKAIVACGASISCCRHCGQPLRPENTWMEDGCPCNEFNDRAKQEPAHLVDCPTCGKGLLYSEDAAPPVRVDGKPYDMATWKADGEPDLISACPHCRAECFEIWKGRGPIVTMLTREKYGEMRRPPQEDPKPETWRDRPPML